MSGRLVVQTLADPGERIDPRVDAVELRLDLYPDLEVGAWIERCERPVIVTVRRERDGGAWQGSEEGRRELFRGAAGADYVDVEWDADAELAPVAPRRIVSHHDCEGVPTDLPAIVGFCEDAGADRVKIAVTPHDATAALSLLDLPCAAIGMGEAGRFTRVLSSLTYCAVEPVAPGMPTPDELFDDFRIGRLGARPALLGVARKPIEHSRSPQFHNPLLERDGLDAVYLRYLVDDLVAFWPEFVARGGAGLSITAPLKEQAVSIAEIRSPEVVASGAANTLLSDGCAFNTDVWAFHELLPRDCGDTLVMGAGGAARAAVAALRERGSRFRVWARRREAVEALGVESVSEPGPAEVVINTTPAPSPAADFVVDLVYGQPGREPPERGVGGVEFLEAQARHQYRLFAEHLGSG